MEFKGRKHKVAVKRVMREWQGGWEEESVKMRWELFFPKLCVLAMYPINFHPGILCVFQSERCGINVYFAAWNSFTTHTHRQKVITYTHCVLGLLSLGTKCVLSDFQLSSWVALHYWRCRINTNSMWCLICDVMLILKEGEKRAMAFRRQ